MHQNIANNNDRYIYIASYIAMGYGSTISTASSYILVYS